MTLRISGAKANNGVICSQCLRHKEHTPPDRFLWAGLCAVWKDWRSSVFFVQPSTIIGWHRKGFRLFWTWKVRCGIPGRPAVPQEIRDVIRTMSRENPIWGAPRIHSELLKLGLAIGETCVSKYMIRRRRPPSQTWRTFLENHLKNMVSVDFFTVPTIRFQILYVFLVLAHDRRRILHCAATAHPTAEWTAHQLREAFPWDTAPHSAAGSRSHFRSGVRGAGEGHGYQTSIVGTPLTLAACLCRTGDWHHTQRMLSSRCRAVLKSRILNKTGDLLYVNRKRPRP
jgi:hypothetical protein